MPFVFSRSGSPTILLYAFIVIAQIGFGFYYGRQFEPPAAAGLINGLALLWVVGWWMRADSRKRRIAWAYDTGFFLYLAWPLVMPYYLVKSRGAKGLLVILGFIGVYVGAVIIGIMIGVLTS